MSGNPFPGLRPFTFEESELFFGRDSQSEELIVRLARNRFLAVVGASGSGKSSLVRAGLLPALLGGFMTRAGSDWQIAVMRPGNDPVGNLALSLHAAHLFGRTENSEVQAALTEAVLRRGGLGLVNVVRQAGLAANQPVLIVVDQFEEIFRFARAFGSSDYQNEAAAFVKLILEAARSPEVPVYVVLTMRSDFLGECSLFWGLPEAVNDNQYLVPRLTRDQQRESITGPVAVGGGEITPRLVSRLLNDVGDDQDQLPILQHALMRTWDQKVREGLDHEPLDLRHYEAIGGMAEALSIHADEAYGELPDDRSREVAQKLFKRLTEKGPDNREIRRPCPLSEICESAGATQAEAITVIDTFRQAGRSFLMPPAGSALDADSLIDISHESLIRGWKRLRGWVEEEAESARMYRRLAETALLHAQGKAALWGNPDLQGALDWRAKNSPSGAWASRYAPGFETAMTFLDASEEQCAAGAREQEFRQAQEMERAKHELAQAQALAEAQRQNAEGQRQRLEEQARSAARLRRLTAASLVLALLALGAAFFAIAAYRRSEASRKAAFIERKKAEDASKVADAKTAEAVSSTQLATRQQQLAENNSQMALSGELAARSNQLRGDAPRLFMRSLLVAIEAHRRYPGQESDTALRASLALAPVPGPLLKQPGVEDIAFSPDARYVFTASRDKMLRVYDRQSGKEIARLVHGWGVNSLALNADASLVVCGTGDPPHDVNNNGIINLSNPTAGEAVVWDWRTKKALARLPFDAPVTMVRFVGNGDMVAASDTHSLKTATFDRKANSSVKEIVAAANGSWISSFSDDGTLAAVHQKDDAQIFNLVTGANAGSVKATEPDIIFSPDKKLIAATGTYVDTRVLEVAGGKQVAKLGKSSNSAFSPDGKSLVLIDDDGIARVWGLAYSDNLGVMERGEMLSGSIIDLAAFLPDSKALATTLDDAAVRVWEPYKKIYGDAASFFELFRAAEDKVTAMTVSRDGRFLVSGDPSGARVWELESGSEVKRWSGASHFTFGQRYAATSAAKDLRVMDLRTNAQVATVSTTSQITDLRLSPDESRIAVVVYGGIVEFRQIPNLKLLQRVNLSQDIESMEFSNDGKSLMVAWAKGTITEIEVAGTGRTDRVTNKDRADQIISPHSSYFAQFSPSPDKNFNVEVLELFERSGRKIGSIRASAFGTATRFAPNESFLVSQADDKSLGVWNSTTGELLVRIPATGLHSPFAISPDSRYVASPAGSQITVWDVGARKQVRTFDHFSSVASLAFSPDSRNLLANCDTLRVWSMDDGELKSVIGDDTNSDRSFFTRDEKYIVTQKDRTLGGATPYLRFQLWHPDDLVAEGCRRATRNMTDSEWQEYLRSEPKRKTCPNRP